MLLELSGQDQTLALRVAGDPRPKRWRLTGPLPRSLPVHPTQLYSFIDSMLLCVFLLAYYPFRRRDGELTALTLTLHPISRFLLEIIRIDETPCCHALEHLAKHQPGAAGYAQRR